MSDSIDESPWGWDRYERTSWIREDGRPMYVGHFRMNNDPHHWTICRVRFWARRPILALREIVISRKHPEDFADRVIN